jgi:hypothetical protein
MPEGLVVPLDGGSAVTENALLFSSDEQAGPKKTLPCSLRCAQYRGIQETQNPSLSEISWQEAFLGYHRHGGTSKKGTSVY